MRSSCQAFTRLVINEKGPAHSHGFCKKAGRASQGKQASEQLLSMTSASASDPGILPCLSSCPDLLREEQPLGSVSRINPFLPDLLLA